jgi:hypothetical protein
MDGLSVLMAFALIRSKQIPQQALRFAQGLRVAQVSQARNGVTGMLHT